MYIHFLDLGIYTRVSAYIDWIKNVTAGEQSNDLSKIAQGLMSSTNNYQQISYILLLIEILFLISKMIYNYE
jgi:hypothetical protein